MAIFVKVGVIRPTRSAISLRLLINFILRKCPFHVYIAKRRDQGPSLSCMFSILSLRSTLQNKVGREMSFSLRREAARSEVGSSQSCDRPLQTYFRRKKESLKVHSSRRRYSWVLYQNDNN